MNLTNTLARALLLAACTCALPATAQDGAAQARGIVVENTSHADFATTLGRLKGQLEADGWNIVAEINLGARLAKKGVAIPGGLVILELTSGKNAVPLLKADDTRYVSALMPCSVSIYGMSDGRVMISRMNAAKMAGMLEPRVAEVMRSASLQLDETIHRALTRSEN